MVEPKSRIHRISWISMAAAFLWLGLSNATAAEPDPVLVLHSYHRGLKWSDALQTGVENAVAESGRPLSISLEYLDAKRHPGRRLFPSFAELFARKYAQWQPAVILSCDDDALQFLFAYRDRLFPDVPVVFCGLNVEDFDPAILEGRSGYTGIVERLDLSATIEVIPRLQPEVARVVFIHDQTTTGLANRRMAEALAPGFADRLEFVFPERDSEAEEDFLRHSNGGLSERELLAYLKGLKPDTAVFFLGFYLDRFNASFELETILPRICQASPVPVYGYSHGYLGLGVLGGKLLSGKMQGHSAAAKAIRLLNGEPVETIPVTVESSHQFMFDDRVRRRFRIPQKRMPPDAILLNIPPSFVERHRVAMGWSLVAAFLALFFFLILFFNVSRRLRAEEKAVASERKYRLLADHSADVIWTMDAEHRLTYVSPSAERFFGYSMEEMVRLKWEDWLTGESMNILQDGIAKRMKDWECTDSAELKMVRKNGRILWTEVVARGFRDETGRPHGVVGVIRDITERRRAEADLRESERRYREIYGRTPVMLHSIGADGRIVSVSDYWLRVMEYQRDEVLGRPSTDFLTAESRRLAAEEYIPRFMETGEAWNISYQFVKKSGEVVDVLMSAIAEADGEGGFLRSLAVLQDVTDRKRAEAALRESEERLRLVLEAGELGFWDWDIDSGSVRRNERWGQILGFSKAEIHDTVRQWIDLIHPEDRGAAIQSIWNHLDGKTPIHAMEYRMRSKTGEFRWVFDRARIVRRDAEGKPLRMCGTHVDITDRKQREENDRKAARRRETVRRHQSLSTMAGAVAHNFNNLLMAVLGNLDIVLADLSRFDSSRELIESAHQSAMRAAGLSRLMLLYVGQGQERNETFCLLEVIREQKSGLIELGADRIRLSFPADREWEPCWIRGDRGRLAEVLQNLAVNAAEAMGEVSGEVAIRLERRYLTASGLEENYGLEPPGEGWFVGLSVSDTGCGMTEETRRRLFEPYYTTKFTGRGLGLAVVLGIVRSHGGVIQVQSEEGAGSRITLFFPEVNGTGRGNSEPSGAGSAAERPSEGSLGDGREKGERR